MRRRLFPALLCVSLLLSACGGGPSSISDQDTSRPAWVDDAVIYELFVRDFTPEGTFRAIIPRLPELRRLGVTTIWLMPIHPIGEEQRKGSLGSPYSIQDYYAVNPNFGTEEDFQALVDAVHAHDMRLIIDFVANHTAWDNAWVAEHPSWYTHDSTEQIISPIPDWSDVADLNYDNPEVQAEMKKVMRYWVEEFDIDGYRCDVAEMVPLDFWDDAITELRAVKPIMMLAEGEDPELHRHGFDISYGWTPYHTLKKVWSGQPAANFITVVDSLRRAFPEDALRLRFTTNHDETAWDAPPPVLFNGLDGARAASVAMMTLPGVPLLYNGQEVGSTDQRTFFEKNTIDWSQNAAMRAFYEDLIGLYNTSSALRGGSFDALTPTANDALLFTRTADAERLLIAINVRDQRTTALLPDTLSTVTFTDALTGATFLGEALILEPYEYRILRARRES